MNEGRATNWLDARATAGFRGSKRDERPLNNNEMQKHTLSFTSMIHVQTCPHTNKRKAHTCTEQDVNGRCTEDNATDKTLNTYQNLKQEVM